MEPLTSAALITAGSQLFGNVIGGIGGGISKGKELKENRRQFDVSSGLQSRQVATDEMLARQKIEEYQRRQRYLKNLRASAGNFTKRAVMAMTPSAPKTPSLTQGVVNGI